MTTTGKPTAPTAEITVANYRMDERLDQGRLKHCATFPLTERESLISEALRYGLDIQYKQAKYAEDRHILWYSANGFSQR